MRAFRTNFSEFSRECQMNDSNLSIHRNVFELSTPLGKTEEKLIEREIVESILVYKF